VLVFVPGSLLTLAYPANVDGNGLARLLRGGESTMQGSALQRVSTGRTDMWTDAAERFTTRPLTGFGVDQYQRLDGLRSRVQEPHNSWILLWFEGGLIALCAMATLVGLWFLRLWCARSSPVVQTLLALGVALGLLSLVDSVHYWVTSLILMAYLGGVGWAYGQAWPRTQATSIPRPLAWLVTVVIAALSGWGLWQEQVLSDPTLKPTDMRLAWIRPMPLSHWYFLTHLQGWEQRQELTYPELNAWYDWLVAKGETPWFFQIQHAYVQARAGETAVAIAGLEEGLRDAPSAIRRETQAQHEPALNQLKARLAYEQAQP